MRMGELSQTIMKKNALFYQEFKRRLGITVDIAMQFDLQ